MNYSTKQIPFAPIVSPTEEEFANFKEFVYRLSERKDVKSAGCAKAT